MPTPPYSKLLVSVNGGAAQSGRVDVAVGDVCQFSAASTVGVNSYRWEIYSYPSGFATPSGWTLGSDGVLRSTAAVPAPVTIDPWGKYLPRLVINNDLNRQDWVDESTGISAPSPSGLVDLAHLEANQFDSDEGWVGDQKANLRQVAAGIFASPTGGDVGKYLKATAAGVVAWATVAGGGGLTPPVNPTDDGKAAVASGGDLTYTLLSNAHIAAAAAIDVTKLAAGSAGQVLVNSGGTNQWGSIVNANIDATAAIAGTKISPDFGSQNVVTTGYMQPGYLRIGATVSGTGDIRLTKTGSVYGVNNAGTGNLRMLALGAGSDDLWLGEANVTNLKYYAGTEHQLLLGAAKRQVIAAAVTTHIVETPAGGGADNGVVSGMHSTDAAGSTVMVRKSRGTYASPSVVSDATGGDLLGAFAFSGYDGSVYQSTAGIKATVSGAVSAGTVPTKLEVVLGASTAGLANVATFTQTTTQIFGSPGGASVVDYGVTTASRVTLGGSAGTDVVSTGTMNFYISGLRGSWSAGGGLNISSASSSGGFTVTGTIENWWGGTPVSGTAQDSWFRAASKVSSAGPGADLYLTGGASYDGTNTDGSTIIGLNTTAAKAGITKVIQVADTGAGTPGLGFFAATPIAKPTVTGAKAGNAALTSLCSQLASLGLITDSTT